MKPKNLAYCALFAAFIVVAAQISIPIQPVPLNLASLAVMAAGILLGAKSSIISVAVYILIGCVGLPVFANFRGGVAIIAGPTGGYILGYLLIALITGFVCEKTNKLVYAVLSMIFGTVICYVAGTAWFCILTGTSPYSALAVCVTPFLPADLLKIIAAATIFKKIKWRV